MVYDLNDIPRPYSDWEGLMDYLLSRDREFTDWQLCEICIGMKENDAVLRDSVKNRPEILDMEDTPFLSFDETRRLATMRFLAELDRKGIPDVQLSRKTGVSTTILSKFRSSVNSAPDLRWQKLRYGSKKLTVPEEIRPFALPTAVMGAAAAEACSTSVHDLMFGEESRIVLPPLLVRTEKRISALSPADRNRCIRLGQRYRDMAVREFSEYRETTPLCEGMPEYGQFRPSDEIIRERFLDMTREIRDTDYKRYAFFHEFDGPVWVRYAIGHLVQEQRPVKGKMAASRYVPSLPYLMLWSMLTHQTRYIRPKALDYFLCNDYIMVEDGAGVTGTPKNRIPIFTVEDGQEREVTDLDTLRILSFCAALPEKYKDSYMTAIL